jgi:ribosomal protein S18
MSILYDEKDIVYEADRDNEYKGEYLYPSKCKTDIKLDKCLKDCTRNSKCVAVEYNPKFKDYKNVCCLKSTITEKIKRRPNAENGTLYIKKISNFNDSNKNNIII